MPALNVNATILIAALGTADLPHLFAAATSHASRPDGAAAMLFAGTHPGHLVSALLPVRNGGTLF